MTQGMDQFLAAYYGTGGEVATIDKTAAAAEAAEQEASFELFAKVAQAQGIDLTSMSDEDVMALYTKVASEDEEPKEKEEEEKKEEEKKEKEATAKAELAAKTAAASPTLVAETQEKIAEADYLGRIMAHAYVQEMKKIAAEVDAGATTAATEPTDEQKIASMKDSFLANLKKGKGAVGAAAGKAKEHAGAAFGKAKERGAAAGAKIKEHAGKAVETAKKHPGATHGAAGAAGVGAGFAAGHAGKEKKSSALDELAAERAMAKLAAAGYDVNQGAELLSQLLTKGASEDNSKIASANGDLEGALEIRSIELLGQCGYPIDYK